MDTRNLLEAVNVEFLRELSDQQRTDLGFMSACFADEFTARECFQLGAAHGIALERERRAAEEIEKLNEMLG